LPKERGKVIIMVVGAFDFWDEHAILEYHKDNVRIYNLEGEEYLFVDQVMYASTSEKDWYVHNVMPFAKGRCLEIGLGLGAASRAMLAKKEVKYILTIEKDEGVIAAFGRPLRRHNILNTDIYEWVENFAEPTPMYDFIFVDHYATMDEDLFEELKPLAIKLSQLLKPDGKMVFWIDENLSPEEIEMFKQLWIV
jgi:spermidine synthase